MLNIGILSLLLVLTACPKKEDVVKPKKSDLEGKWEWISYMCGHNCFPLPIEGVHIVVYENDSITYYKNDTLLLKTNYEVKNLNNEKYLSIDFKDKKNSLIIRTYSSFFLQGKYTIVDRRLRIGDNGFSSDFKKI